MREKEKTFSILFVHNFEKLNQQLLRIIYSGL